MSTFLGMVHLKELLVVTAVCLIENGIDMKKVMKTLVLHIIIGCAFALLGNWVVGSVGIVGGFNQLKTQSGVHLKIKTLAALVRFQTPPHRKPLLAAFFIVIYTIQFQNHTPNF